MPPLIVPFKEAAPARAATEARGSFVPVRPGTVPQIAKAEIVPRQPGGRFQFGVLASFGETLVAPSGTSISGGLDL
jgi:hypothetical protein